MLAIGTQVGLAGSMHGLRELLGDLAHVTGPEGTAVVDSYDPAEAAGLLGHRRDTMPGLAYRVMSFAYEGDIGDIRHFRLFSPGRVREAVAGTGWTVADVRRSAGSDGYYRLALEKR